MSNWKTPGHKGIHRFWFKRLSSIHDRLVLEMSRLRQGADVTKWMAKGKKTLIKKTSKVPSQQLQTHNVPTNDVKYLRYKRENIKTG